MIKGFTFVEVLVSVLILGFLIAIIFAVLDIGNIAYNDDMGLVNLQQQARLGMEWMVKEIRQSGRDPTTYNATIDADGKAITFSIHDISNISNIRYYLNSASHQIIRQQPAGTGTPKILANDINGLSFCWWDGVDCCNPASEDCSNLYVLQIQLGAAKTVSRRSLSLNLTEKVRLRNP